MAFKLQRPVMFSMEGYKSNSPDVKNKQNLIPSGDITMEGVDFPVHGVDNKGNEKVMEPGKNYKFPGDKVLETPLQKSCNCWESHERVPGTKPCAKGSCRKK